MARPIDTVNQLVDAINQGDLDRAVAAYEAGAVLVAQPGQLARGSIQIREALAGFIVLQATLETETRELIEAGDVALYVSRWSLRGTDPTGKPVAMAGESADVLRRQQDGRWRIAVDNPWGAGILGSRG
jgi:ketosteroid isomerase-like protein